MNTPTPDAVKRFLVTVQATYSFHIAVKAENAEEAKDLVLIHEMGEEIMPRAIAEFPNVRVIELDTGS